MMFFLILLWNAFLLILVPKLLRKGSCWEAFRTLFGDLEPIAGNCDFRRDSNTLAMFHPPRRVPKSDFFGLVFGTCSEGSLRDDFVNDFEDFELYLGIPGEPIFGQWADFVGFDFSFEFP